MPLLFANPEEMVSHVKALITNFDNTLIFLSSLVSLNAMQSK